MKEALGPNTEHARLTGNKKKEYSTDYLVNVSVIRICRKHYSSITVLESLSDEKSSKLLLWKYLTPTTDL